MKGQQQDLPRELYIHQIHTRVADSHLATAVQANGDLLRRYQVSCGSLRLTLLRKSRSQLRDDCCSRPKSQATFWPASYGRKPDTVEYQRCLHHNWEELSHPLVRNVAVSLLSSLYLLYWWQIQALSDLIANVCRIVGA